METTYARRVRARLIATARRIVRGEQPNAVALRTARIGDASVITYFLGLDYGGGAHAPMVFETIVMGGDHDGHRVRCATREMAEECHRRALALVDAPPQSDGAGGDG